MSIQTYKHMGFAGWVPAHHTVKKFAGGEMHVELAQLDSQHQMIVLRGADSDDIMTLLMWADACRRGGATWLVAVIPYLPGARADRSDGKVSLGAKVYADLINSAKLDRVICIDPHSWVAPALYNNLETFSAVDAMAQVPHALGLKDVSAVVAPDAGASARAREVAKAIGVPLLQGSKERDFYTGELSGFQMIEDIPDEGEILVVDDICDGGRTFINFAEAQEIPRERMALWVTHGVFSHGAVERLADYYSWIGTTDSHPGSMGMAEAVVSFNVPDFQPVVVPVLKTVNVHTNN